MLSGFRRKIWGLGFGFSHRKIGRTLLNFGQNKTTLTEPFDMPPKAKSTSPSLR